MVGRKRSTTILLWLPIPLLVAATAVIGLCDGDMRLARHFSHGQDWPQAQLALWRLLYDFGNVPALLVGGLGALILLRLPFRRPSLFEWQTSMLLALSLALGPGLLINGILKPLTKRPRPNQVAQFGGTHDYIPVLAIGSCPDHKSFPCGHASMGFFLLTPLFAIYRRHPRWAWGFLVLGLAYGTLMGMARLVAGRHFLSDVLWSGGIVYLSGLLVHYALGLHRLPSDQDETEDEPVIIPIFGARQFAPKGRKAAAGYSKAA